MRRCLPALIILLALNFPFYVHAEKLKIVFLNPGYPEQNSTGNFWRNVSSFMQAAADDLSIELITLYACRDHILMKSLVDKLISYQADYVVLVNEKGVVLDMVKQLANSQVPMFFLLNGLTEEEFNSLSQEERKLIKGSVIPDNYTVGYQLLEQLVELSRKAESTPSHKYLLALQGDFTTPASLEREHGFKQAVANETHVVLLDSTVANWSKQQAYQKVKGILHRNRIDMIWAANDAMAFGAKQAVSEANLDYPVVIGGVNWDIDDKQYPLDISYGGHVTLGAYAMVMLKDIANNELTNEQRQQKINIFAASTAPYYQTFVERLAAKQLSQYDFTVFSKEHQQSLPFTVKNLVDVALQSQH